MTSCIILIFFVIMNHAHPLLLPSHLPCLKLAAFKNLQQNQQVQLAWQPHYTHYYVTPDFHGTMLQIIPANVLKYNGQHDNSGSSYEAT
jgi:hypothetical protein